jgi:vancomycin resistance protein YoaR
MSRSLRLALIAAALPVLLILWASIVFAMDRASNGGEVLGAVDVGDVEISGLSREEARIEILRLEYRLATTPFPATLNGSSFELMPYVVGFDLDEDAMVDAAMSNGREGGLARQFGWWLGNFGGSARTAVPLVADYDRDALEDLLAYWESIAVDDPPFEGGIFVADGAVVPDYPRTGTGVDVTGGVAATEAVLFGFDRPTIEIPTELRVPTTTDAAVDAAVAEADALIDGSVVLTRTVPSVRVEFPASVLAEAVRSRRVTASDGTEGFEIYFDPEPFRRFIDPIRDQIEVPPQDAQIVVRPDETPTIIPGRNGTVVDENAVAGAVMAAARSVTRNGVFPFTDGAEPEFTTAEAEELGIRDLLYRAVTFFPPGGDERNQNRINNITRIAEEVDGAIVLPGEVFSLNEYVGQRTEEDGYKRAGAIIGDEVYCCDHPANVGGGVSQFTTTLYNAVFWAGLEDVEHKPHTLYFSRYPEGREATLGWPVPDLKFRNDTEHGILIDTETGEDSVTVRLYGDNGDRVVEGDLSERRLFTEPETKYKPSEDVNPGEEEIADEGAPGWTVTVFRTITYPDGTVAEQSWEWTYDPFPRIIEVHPCELPPNAEDYVPGVQCPVQVPDVGGLTVAEATAALNGVGVFIATGEPFLVTDPELVGTVRSQDPAPETWVDLESTVTVRIGELDTATTTTTTTTTTTVP